MSDLLAQAGERKRAASTGETVDRPDYRRVSRFMLTGLGSGVCWNYWFDFEQYITDMWTADLSGQTLAVARTALGVVLEQFLMIPFYFSLYLIPTVSLQNGVALACIPNEVVDKVPSLFVNNAKVWTPANLIIYNLPVEWRCMGSNTVDVLWGVICSTLVNQPCKETDTECLLEEALLDEVDSLEGACELDACAIEPPRSLVGLPRISRGRGISRLVRRRVRDVAGIGMGQ